MTQHRGSCGQPWISCTPGGDTGFYLENGKIIWVVEAIKRTFEEWSKFVIKRGHMDAVHVAFVRNLLIAPLQKKQVACKCGARYEKKDLFDGMTCWYCNEVVQYEWDIVDPPEETKNYIGPKEEWLRNQKEVAESKLLGYRHCVIYGKANGSTADVPYDRQKQPHMHQAWLEAFAQAERENSR